MQLGDSFDLDSSVYTCTCRHHASLLVYIPAVFIHRMFTHTLTKFNACINKQTHKHVLTLSLSPSPSRLYKHRCYIATLKMTP